MKSWLVVIALLFFRLASYAQLITSEDYRVYETILNRDSASKAKVVVIIKELVGFQEANAVSFALKENDLSTLNTIAHEIRFDSISTATIRHYFAASVDAEKFMDASAWPVLVNLLSKRSFEKLFSHNVSRGWKSFYRKFPGAAGAFSFSKVTYSILGDRAVTYRGVQRDGLNGNGSLFVLEKIRGYWQVKYRFKLWDN